MARTDAAEYQAPQEQDPFAGILDRSSIAQALREARASLARPSRPFTPACRSLFQQADDPAASRPNSSYSIDQLKFVGDTFASTSGSLLSARSGNRSGELCLPISEEGELEAPELSLDDLEPEVATFGDAGELLASSGGAALREAPQGEAMPDDEEYDCATAADDLAMRMDVPSDSEDESDREDPSRACTPAGTPAGSSTAANKPPLFPGERLPPGGGKPRLPPTPTRKEERARDRSSSVPGRKRSEKRTSLERSAEKPMHRSSSSGAKEWTSGLRQALQELEALQQGPSVAGAEAVAPLAERLRGLASDLRKGGLGAQQEKQAPRVLKAVLLLMDRGVDSPCLLRLAHCSLDLLRVGTVLQDVGGQGVAAAYLNVARALFKLSKDSSLDAQFREEGLMDQLLNLLASCELHCAATDLRIYVVGILKNLTNSDDNQRHLAKRGALPVLQALMRSDSLLGSSKEVQLLIQVTALLRNIVCSSSKRQTQLAEIGMLADLTRVSKMYTSNEELQVNISRIFGKLSTNERACAAFEQDGTHVRQVVRCLQAHAGVAPLVLRLSFLLGNLAARSEELRQQVMFEWDAISVLPALMERYWRLDRKLAQAEAASSRVAARLEAAGGEQQAAGAGGGGRPKERGSDAQDCESVMVKLVRLVANATISPRVGTLIASNATVVDPLLDILGCKRMTESEELVLSTTAAVTNLLFHESEENLLFSSENKQLLCRLLRPMLLESYNVEALVEAARALGNLSRHPDARQWIAELRVDEVLCILLAHDDRDLIFYSCGALVNLAADPPAGRRLCGTQGLRPKLAALLRDAPADDAELMLVAVKVLSNLGLADEGGESAEEDMPWPQQELDAVRAGLLRACELPRSEEAPETSEVLAELASRLLSALPAGESAVAA